ncbi:MAG: glycosyltransferase [Desulfuromonadales bacterium]|nr:MAG: glycosyltransferase [Desulfuromonadales bacterium]
MNSYGALYNCKDILSQYSVCIRTLGTSANRFERLLRSIEGLTVQPNEIIVVLPHGYAAPPELSGNEQVVFSNKGMLAQRIKGIESASNEHVLLLDDDVEFEPAIVNKLMLAMAEYDADIVYPINRELLPSPGKAWLRAITLQAIARKNQEVFIHMLPTGGYSYLDTDPPKPVPSESCPGMLLLAKRSVLLAINLDEDLWVDTSPYGFRDDAILSYKAHLLGYKIYAVPGIMTRHLCGTTRLDAKRDVYSAYSVGCNSLVFWKRFIYVNGKTVHKKLIAATLFAWSITGMVLLYTVNSLLKCNLSIVNAYLKGTIAGMSKNDESITMQRMM